MREHRGERRGFLARARAAFAHAFALPGQDPLAADDEALLDKIAAAVAKRGLAAASLMMLETGKPFHGLLFQAGTFFAPIVEVTEPITMRIVNFLARDRFTADELRRFALILERPDAMETLSRKIEKASAR